MALLTKSLATKPRRQLGVFCLLLSVHLPLFAACNESDVPLGSGTVSSGTQVSTTVPDMGANGSGSGDGTFTYQFNSGGQPARCGRHADGTWWLAPAVGETSVQLSSISSNFAKLRAEDNPDPARRGFLDNSEDYGFYDDSANIIPSLPINYPMASDAITSLFAVIQRPNGCGTRANVNECVEFANFLTVYRTLPADGGKDTIRPTLFGRQKQVYTWADFDRSRIPSFAEARIHYSDNEVLEQLAKWTATTEGFSMPICNDDYSDCDFASEGGRAFRSHAVIDDYATFGGQVNTLSYFLSDTADVINNVEDAALLAATIAYGIDVITLLANPPAGEKYGFASGAGQFMNAADFSYFTAALSPRDGLFWNTMKNIANAMLESPYRTGPQEMQQVFDVAGDGPVWGDGAPTFGQDGNGPDGVRRYWTELIRGLAHDNSGNWYTFTTPSAGTTFEVRDSTTGRVAPATCDLGGSDDPNSICRPSTVLVNKRLMGYFDQRFEGSQVIFKNSVPAGSLVEISPIYNRRQGAVGGNRAGGDPYGQVDGPPAVPGAVYFGVTTPTRLSWAAIGQAIPELCEVINYPQLFQFAERYMSVGIKAAGDKCAPPSDADVAGDCDVFRSTGCVDYGPVNNGTARWGPDPRYPDEIRCIENNRLLTRDGDTWVETVENRGDNGRFSRFHGVKLASFNGDFSPEYLAFKGDRRCEGTSTDPVDPTPPVQPSDDDDDLLYLLPAILSSDKIKNRP